MLTIWIGDPFQLKLFEGLLKFLWAGQKDSTRNRVDAETITRSKKNGGLGVLSLSDQVRALVAKLILWALT